MNEGVILAAIAAFTTLLGSAMAILSFVSNRKNSARKASAECYEKLLASQREAEKLSDELHLLKMERSDE